MNKAELITSIADQTGSTKASVDAFLKAQANAIHTALATGDDVTIPEVGKLKTVQKAARTGRNPSTGATIAIPARTAVKFTSVKALDDTLSHHA